MYYPDKYESHTRRLSDSSYRIYHRMLNWMWLHSDNHYTMKNDPIFIATVLCDSPMRVATALDEIQLDGVELLGDDGTNFISNGLRKEAEGQKKRSGQGKKAAKKRWSK